METLSSFGFIGLIAVDTNIGLPGLIVLDLIVTTPEIYLRIGNTYEGKSFDQTVSSQKISKQLIFRMNDRY